MPKISPKTAAASTRQLRNRDLNSGAGNSGIRPSAKPKISKLVQEKYNHEQARTSLYWRHQAELRTVEARQSNEMELEDQHNKKVAAQQSHL